MGNDHALEIVGVGSIKVKMDDGVIHIIPNVWHVKGLKKNLLSMGQLDDLGYEFHVEEGIMKVIRGALAVMKAEEIVVNLYMLHGLSQTLEKNWQWSGIANLVTCQKRDWKSSLIKSCFLVHFDVWESLITSLGGTNYLVLFVDDYSKRCWVYLIKR